MVVFNPSEHGCLKLAEWMTRDQESKLERRRRMQAAERESVVKGQKFKSMAHNTTIHPSTGAITITKDKILVWFGVVFGVRDKVMLANSSGSFSQFT